MKLILLQAFDMLIGDIATNTYEEVVNTFSSHTFDLLLPRTNSSRLMNVKFGAVDILNDFNASLITARDQAFPYKYHLLFEIAGIVSLFYNIAGYKILLTPDEAKSFRLADRNAAGRNATSLVHTYSCPVFVAIINHNVPAIDNVEDTSWWGPRSDWIDRVKLAGKRLKFKNYTIDQMSLLVSDAIDHMREYATLKPEPYTGYVEHPHLPGARVRPWHLGLGRDVAHNFVVDCIQSLVPDTSFRIHVDAVATWPVVDDMSGDFGENIYQMHLLYDSNPIMEAEAETAWGKWKIGHMLNTLFVPGTQQQAPEWDIIAPYHVSIELDEVIYDSMYAYEGVPLEEYRSKLNSTWHRVIDVPVGADPDKVVQELADLVEAAKNARTVPQ